MPPRTSPRLDDSDIAGGVIAHAVPVTRELRDEIDSIAIVRATGAPRVFLPDAHARLLVLADASIFVVGPRATAMRKAASTGDAIVIRLALGAVPALLGISTAALTQTVVALDTVAPAVAKQLAARFDPHDQLRAIERLLVGRRRRGDRRLVRHASSLLDGERVAVVARRLGTSDRQLRRMFDDAAGMSPKAYARIERLRRTVALSRRATEPAWASIALDGGYFDQAHMIREFRQLTGSTPAALCRELSAARGT